MGHPNELVIPLYTTHENMCKFSTPQDSSYQTVCSQLQYLAKLSLEKVQKQAENNPYELEMRFAGLPRPGSPTRRGEMSYRNR
jgi:hypothetical protein